MAVMSKAKKPAKAAPDDDEPKPIYLRVDRRTHRALALFISRQPAAPERTTVTLAALHEFLAKHGCWPIEDDE